MDDAEAVQSLLDLAHRHRRGVVGHQRPQQAPLHECLAPAVDEDLGGLGRIPSQVAAQPRVVVEEANRIGVLHSPDAVSTAAGRGRTFFVALNMRF